MKVEELNIGVKINCDIANLSEQDYNDINELYLKHLIIVFENQPYQTLPFAKLISKMGQFANYEQMLWKQDGNNTGKGKQPYIDPFTWEGDDNDYPVQRVTGEKTEKGMATGIFGNGELDWHSNMNGDMDRARGVALQGALFSENTHTAFMDTTKAYADLPDDIKQRCEGVVGNYEYVLRTGQKGVSQLQLMTMKGFGIVDPNTLCPLLHESFRGKTGMYSLS